MKKIFKMNPGAGLVFLGLLALQLAGGLAGSLTAPAQAGNPSRLTSEMIDEAVRKTGLTRQEVMRLYENRSTDETGRTGAADSPADSQEPGRTDLKGVDDSRSGSVSRRPTLQDRQGETPPAVLLPFQAELPGPDSLRTVWKESSRTDSLTVPMFGQNFFHLDAGLFSPPSFGPVSPDYLLGVGDEVVVDVYGGVEMRLTRLVDRDGAIILPQAGRIPCAGRTLAQVARAVTHRLAQTHSSIHTGDADQPEADDTQVEVSLGALRSIKIFVVGEAQRPGSYELSSLSTVLGALYAAGGAAESGSLRDVRLVRQGRVISHLDLYTYLLDGKRQGDASLREGDTVLIPVRGATALVQGEVKRAFRFEMKDGETLDQLIRFAGGFTAEAAPSILHLQRVVPVRQRLPGQADREILDVPLGGSGPVIGDGDILRVDAIEKRLGNWVRIQGMVKQPGQYQYFPGMRAADLVAKAGGLWPEALTSRAIIDRTSPQQDYSSFSFDLGAELNGQADPVLLQVRDELQVFSRWEVQDRPQVTISGEVFAPGTMDFRAGMSLRDLILKAGGLKQSADLLQAEIGRVQLAAVRSTDPNHRPEQSTEVIRVALDQDFLTRDESPLLQAHDRVAIRKLPWWELQRTVRVGGEVFYPGEFSLERQDETISSIIQRAGGLKPDAYVLGARIVRSQDQVGNIAIDLMKALAHPGSQYDLVLQSGDELLIPDRMFTVKVVGEVGFPTSLVFEDGKDINYYVHRAGGFLEQADKKRARVVWPNGMSLPNKGDSRVVAGSTIFVPVKAPPEGPSKLQTMKEISAILAGLATVWLVIDKTAQ